MVPNKQYKYYIGIDCGVNTGVCAWSKEDKQIFYLATIRIHEALDRVRNWHAHYPGTLIVRVEDARLRKQIPRYQSESRERGRREGAGYVKRDAVIWEDFLKAEGIAFEMVAPKDNTTKVDAEYFRKLTGYRGVTSKHARDAAMLVYGY